MEKRKFYPTILTLAVLFASLWLLSGCNESTDPVFSQEPGPGEGALSTVYLSVAIQTTADETAVRSNPTGGEDGDGTEDGLENENTIQDLTVVFFTGTDLNSSLSTLVSEVIYLNSSEILPGNITRVQEVKLAKQPYNVLVVANAGDLRLSLYGKTVREVCDYLQRTAWTVSGSTYSMFTMSSAGEAQIDLTSPTSQSSPAHVIVSLRRLAARVDIIPTASADGDNTYTITESSTETARVVIQKVRLLNQLNAGSFLIRRTAATVSGTPVYLGLETPQSGIQTNYVLDPWTALKTTANLSGNHFDPLLGGAGSAPARDLYTDYFTDVVFTAADNMRPALTGKDFYILGYTLENTMDKESQLNGYSTGVVYETTYIPRQITAYNSATQSNEVVSNNQTITFFSLYNNQSIHGSLESVALLDLNGAQPNDFFAQQFTTANTWQQLKEYAARISYNDKLGFREYLDNLLEGKALTANLDRNISWSAYLWDTYGYSNSNGVVINQGGKNTIRLLGELGINAYENGLSYYPYWIRHSNNNGLESGVMEFGIVRNNIYKLQVLSFTGLGKPEPYNPGTENPGKKDEESNVQVQVWVRNWNLITHPVIVM